MKRSTPGIETNSPETPATAGLTVEHRDRWLLARFAEDHDVLSWAIIGGGARQTRTVAWYQVSKGDLPVHLDAQKFLRQRLQKISAPDAVGLLTERSLEAFVDVEKRYGEVSARCIATVGLSNALRVGEPPDPEHRAGTINLLCRVSAPLSEEGLVEAVAIAAEARALAVLESGVVSLSSALPATGTGTDCIVVAAPRSGEPAPYAGKHTALGHVIGAAVYEAMRQGVEKWRREHPDS